MKKDIIYYFSGILLIASMYFLEFSGFLIMAIFVITILGLYVSLDAKCKKYDEIMKKYRSKRW